MERHLTSGQILPRSFCPKKGLEWWRRKVNRHKIFFASKGDNWRQRKNINIQCWEAGKTKFFEELFTKKVLNNAFARVTNCFYSFGMFVRNIKQRKVQRSLLLYLSVIGQLEEKAGVFGHLTVFKHFRTSGHQLQNFHCHFHFLPRSLKNSQSDAKCCSSWTKLHCTQVAWIFGHKHLIMSIFWWKKLSFAHALSPDILFYRFSQFLLQIHHISLPPISWKFSI